MKRLVILGSGTGGTLLANRARRELPRGWTVTVVDPELVPQVKDVISAMDFFDKSQGAQIIFT